MCVFVCVCLREREQNDVQSFMKTLKMEQVPVQIPSQTTRVNIQCIFLFIYLIYLFLTTVHVHCYIRYFRLVVIDGELPSAQIHSLCDFYALAALGAGFLMYKKNNHKFLYYV